MSDPILENLQRTIDESLVRTVFQPIVGVRQAGVIAYEALTRPDPISGFSYPDDLFDAAEAHGLIWDLECVTRRAALEAAADWPASTLLFLNVTPAVIADDRFAAQVLEELDELGTINPGRIVIEITERSENQHIAGLQRQAEMLQRHGFQIAIDDVGAGTSGLNRIMLLKPQWLKLDRALVTDIDQDPVRTNLIRFLSHFGRLSGVSIIAEGLERPEEFERIVQLGVDAAQGYLLGRPGTADQSLAEDLAAKCAEWLGSARDEIFPRECTDSLVSIMRPVVEANPTATIGQVREQIESNPNAEGAVISYQADTTYWLPAESILDEATDPESVLLELAVPVERAFAFNDRIDLTLECVASEPDIELDSLFAIQKGTRTPGVVRLRDLLRAGSEVYRAARHRSATLTGLPGRVRCEQQLSRAFREDANREVAFVDIRGLSEYNAVFGFDLGDQLITTLVNTIEEVARDLVGLDTDAAFLGHLGDDRLILVTDPGFTKMIARPTIERFESRVISTGISPQIALSGVGGSPAVGGVSIRYLIVPNIKAIFSSPVEVMRTEPILRAMADEQAAIDPTRAGYIVEIPSNDDDEDVFMIAA